MIILVSVCVVSSFSTHASGTGAGLAEWALGAYNQGWSYVYGSATPGAVDCSGLIWSYCGGERVDMLGASTEYGYVSSGVPRVHGLGLHQPGHVGVYIGDGMAVDARDESSGVCYDSVYNKSWVEWFRFSAVSYTYNGWEKFNGNYYYYENGEYVVSTSREIGGVTYSFDSTGASDKTPGDMNAVANNSGSSSSSTPKKSSSSSESSSDTGSDSSYEEPEETKTTYQLGDFDDEVIKIQSRLAELGYYKAEVTGYFGELTQKAYRKFQKTAGFTVDGIAGQNELEFLYSDDAPSAPVKTEKKETVQEEKTTYRVGDYGDKVLEIQTRLAELGYYDAELTGFYGEVTEAAVTAFQLNNGLYGTGEVEEDTLAILLSENAVPAPETEEVEEAEEAVEEETEPEFVVKTDEPVIETNPIYSLAEDNAQAAGDVALTTNKLTKKALASLKATDAKAATIETDEKNAGFLVWMFVVLGVAVVISGVMFILSRRGSRYTGTRTKSAKKSNPNVRYW